MNPVALSPDQREAALDAMESTELDVLVVGGGVVGGGAALDAATRGLSVGPGGGARLRLRDVEPLQQARCTAGCATSRCSTSRWSPRRCRSGAC